MKRKITTLAVLLLMGILSQTTAQNGANQSSQYARTFLISPRAGFDMPFIKNANPYIDYKGGLELGLSLDYYWKRFGLGFDFDYIRNSTKNNLLTTNIYDTKGNLVNNFFLEEEPVQRTFIGIGPSYRWVTNNDKLLIELNARLGIGSVKGGAVDYSAYNRGYQLSYFSGFENQFKPAGKVQTRVSYFFKENFGAHLGAYYMAHFGVQDIIIPNSSTSIFTTAPGSIFYYDLAPYSNGQQTIGTPIRTTFSNSRNGRLLSSVGVFAGVSYRIRAKDDKKKKDTYSLVVTARDKYTKQVLPNTDIAVKNVYGDVVATATTNSFGVVVFDDIKPADYTIEGMLYQTPLNNSSTTESEFVLSHPLQKEVLYTNMEFIVKGNAVECTSNKGLERVKVTVQNNKDGKESSVYTDKNGQYGIRVLGNNTYKIYGQKDMFMSQIETINTNGYNRSATLFVKLEICMDEVNCDKALALKNLHYDLDQIKIRDDAEPELDRVVQFMIDNPSVRLELASHTDSRAASEYNQDLSQKRANAAVAYVVAHGISRSRITGIGYGEMRLLNRCVDGVNCSEAQHQINRRTEMKVSCK